MNASIFPFANRRADVRMPVLWIVAVVLLICKAPDALSNAQFWAEDGRIFFAEQWRSSTPPLLAPYAGYLQLLPRLVAWASSALTPEYAPLAYNGAAIAISALAVAYTVWRLSGWLSMTWLLMAFAVVPSAGDVYGSATNIQWFTQFALIAGTFRSADDAAALTAPKRASWLEMSALALTALSGPFVVIWLLVVSVCTARWKTPEDGGSWRTALRQEVLLLMACAAIIQIVALAMNEVITPEPSSLLPTRAAFEALGVTWTPHPYVEIVNTPRSPLHVLLLGAYGLTALWAFVNLWKAGDFPRRLLVAVLLFGILQPPLAYFKQHAIHTLSSPSHYFLVWGTASVWLLGFLSGRLHRSPHALVAVTSVAIVLALARPDYFRRAPLADLRWKRFANELRTAPGCITVPLNPAPWYMRLPAHGEQGECDPQGRIESRHAIASMSQQQ